MVMLSETGGVVRDGYATVDEAAEYLKISRSGVYRLFSRGVIPKRKVGGATRIDWADLQRILLTGC